MQRLENMKRAGAGGADPKFEECGKAAARSSNKIATAKQGYSRRRNQAADRASDPPRPPIFALKIQGRPGAAGIHALRAVLKVLLRRYQFRCLDCHELKPKELEKHQWNSPWATL
jgi:hypothetical protein